MPKVFLLSPASCSGRRARMLLRPDAAFDLAVRMRTEGVALADAFTFMSGLYFRGKATYARAFAAPPPGMAAALVITPTRGLVPLDARITTADLIEFSQVDIDAADERYRLPLGESVRSMRARVGGETDVVLLGSIASDKYVDVLLGELGERLLFPASFVGRGDMSRGGILLRHVEAGEELSYVPVRGAVRRGPRPPRLEPRR